MPFIEANDRGIAPKDDLPENPARWAGLGKRPGALPLKIVVQIRKTAFVSADLRPQPGHGSVPLAFGSDRRSLCRRDAGAPSKHYNIFAWRREVLESDSECLEVYASGPFSRERMISTDGLQFLAGLGSNGTRSCQRLKNSSVSAM